MCGIAGYASKNETAAQLEKCCRSMTESLFRRGPDGSGIWVDGTASVSLGHRRLSIIDLSKCGAQPMSSRSGRFIASYNGEIYNFRELRSALESKGVRFKGGSDTEVMVEACELYGVCNAVKMFTGMFAISIWDRKEKKLYLVRDRVGIKPIFWGKENGRFVFASELKAIRANPHWKAELDMGSVSDFICNSFISVPRSIYRNVRKLRPGHILEYSPETGEVKEYAYWSLLDTLSGPKKNFKNSGDAVCELEALIKDSVKIRMISDVPFGAFLSGGIDSSLVVALMQSQSLSKIRTFSIGFAEESYNESHYASNVAKYVGTDHSEILLTSDDAFKLVPGIPDIYDEPMADSSQLPTTLLSSYTRKNVTVALSGDGGDELFAGYDKYYDIGLPLRAFFYGLPSPVGALLKCALAALRIARGDSFLERMLKSRHFSVYKLRQVSELLSREYPLAAYIVSPNIFLAKDVVKGFKMPHGEYDFDLKKPMFESIFQAIQYYETTHSMVDDILVKVDRASMFSSLEVRVPILDHRIVEFAFSIPSDLKYRDNMRKWILKQVLFKYVPKEFFERNKAGFVIPLNEWICGKLRPLISDSLSEERIRRIGLFNSGAVSKILSRHFSGMQNYSKLIWNMFVFDMWYARWME